ncbi:MAG: ArsR/SmtB family transcription factor [Kiritimatiellia bacterium]
MLQFDKNQMDKKSAFFKALGHPTRLWIVEQLVSGEHCVCEFVAAVGDKFPTISRHLSVLANAGIISERRDGKRILYRLACPCITQILDCLKTRQN